MILPEEPDLPVEGPCPPGAGGLRGRGHLLENVRSGDDPFEYLQHASFIHTIQTIDPPEKLHAAESRDTLLTMDETTFDAGSDPEEIAAKLGLSVVQWHEGTLYARDEAALYALRLRSDHPDGPRLVVVPEEAHSGYVGEEHHTPREAAVHAGLTVIGEDASGKVVALDGFGRKFLVEKTGNGPMAAEAGWATEDEVRKFTPRHRPWKPTQT